MDDPYTQPPPPAVSDAFVLGPGRTLEHDLEFGIVELSDIALRALSPSVNDPTTAIHCVDRLTEVLAAPGVQPHAPASHTSPDGLIRLQLRNTTFERATSPALDQIRHCGADNPAIASRLLEAIDDLMPIVAAEARPSLRAQALAILRSARSSIDDPVALAGVERLGMRAADEDRRAAGLPR